MLCKHAGATLHNRLPRRIDRPGIHHLRVLPSINIDQTQGGENRANISCVLGAFDKVDWVSFVHATEANNLKDV